MSGTFRQGGAGRPAAASRCHGQPSHRWSVHGGVRWPDREWLIRSLCVNPVAAQCVSTRGTSPDGSADPASRTAPQAFGGGQLPYGGGRFGLGGALVRPAVHHPGEPQGRPGGVAGAALWGSRGLPRRAGPAGQRGRRRRPSKATSTSSGRTSTVRASRPVSRAGNSAVCRASVRPIGPLKVLPGITRGPSPGSPAARASARPSDGPRRSHARPSRSTRDTGHRHGPAAPVTAATTWPRRSPAAPADDRAARVGPVPGLRPGALPTGARKSGGWRPPSRIGCRQP